MRGRGALRLVDDALALARDAGPRALLSALWPSFGLAWLSLMTYYAERIEGTAAFRPVVAALVVLLWTQRARALGGLATRTVQRVLSPHDVWLRVRPATSVASTALCAGLELCIWLTPFVLVLRHDLWLALGCTPLLALRGTLSARWLADASLGADAPGPQQWRTSMDHLHGHRARGLVAEALLIVGTLGLTFNLGAFAGALIALHQDLLGIDLAVVRAFLSPGNTFATLALLGLSCVAIDAVRATLAGVIFAEHAAARQGLHLRALIEQTLRRGPRAGTRIFALCLLTYSQSVRAQTSDEPSNSHVAPNAAADDSLPSDSAASLGMGCDSACAAARARDSAHVARITQILERPEFREFEAIAGEGSADAAGGQPRWLHVLHGWLQSLIRRRSSESSIADPTESLQLPSAWAILGCAFVLAGWVVSEWLRGLRIRQGSLSVRRAPRPVPTKASAAMLLHQALEKADTTPGAAMELVFRAALTGLAEQGHFSLAADKTNTAYLAALSGTLRKATFFGLMRAFEDSAYGDRTPAPDAVLRAAAEVQRLLAPGEPG